MRISDWSSDVCSSDLDMAAQFDMGARALGKVDNAGKARRAARQRMPLAVVAAAKLGAKREQRPPRDEGDHPDRDHPRSEERRVGNECVSRFRSWWSPLH